MKPFRFHSEAQDEFLDAMVSLEIVRAGIGKRFQLSIRKAFDLIRHQPTIGSRVPRTKCRQWILSGFPYSLIYQEMDFEFVIWAVAHHKRKPGYWKKRLRKP